jgi:type III restriction enzyme
LKIPGRTPIGLYNPDWAIKMTGRNDAAGKLYLVRETKGSLDTADLRDKEKAKIACGRKHFTAIGVNYGVTNSFEEMKRALDAAL